MSDQQAILYRTLYMYFPLVDVFAKRELPRKVAITVGHRVMKLREFFVAAEERRQILVDNHAKKTDEGHRVTDPETGRVNMEDQAAFGADWKDMLESVVEDYPVFPSQLSDGDLPEDVTGAEIEALIRLRLLSSTDA